MTPFAVKAEARSRASNFALVGFKAREFDGSRSLRLPLGYPEGKPSDLRDIVVEIYRMLFRFAGICERNREEPDPHNGEGGVTEPGGLGYGPSDDAILPDFSFRLISALRALFSLLRTPSILTLEMKTSPRNGHFDWRQIERQLHRAMYLADGTPVFESMAAPQPVLREQTTDIIGMACWVARDASAHFLNESLQSIAGEALAAEWEALADDFALHYLTRSQSLFGDPTDKTCCELLHILLEIDRHTPFRMPAYLELAELLEAILSYRVDGDGGDSWAMKEFHQAWESVCLEYAISVFKDKNNYAIVTCDYAFLDSEGADERLMAAWRENRKKVFSRHARDRRPDIVVKEGKKFRVIDFKYYSASDLNSFKENKRKRPSHAGYSFNKLAQDIDNLEDYGFLLATSSYAVPMEDISFEMWVPGENMGDEDLKFESELKSELEIRITKKDSRALVQAYGEKFRMWE